MDFFRYGRYRVLKPGDQFRAEGGSKIFGKWLTPIRELLEFRETLTQGECEWIQAIGVRSRRHYTLYAKGPVTRVDDIPGLIRRSIRIRQPRRRQLAKH